jgi:cysteine-rich repeat protein
VTCGNGTLDAVELCDGTQIQAGLDCTDYGRTSGTLACGSSCQIDASGCHTCGDGKVEGPEACDDHDTTGGDGCSSACTVETGWQCVGSQPSSCTPVCGDGIRVGNEACDDGNAASNDGCSASCQVEQDCTCSGTPSTCSCAVVQLITTTTERIETGSLALDGTGQPHATYFYSNNFTDPVTNYSMEHAHAIYAMRPTTSWTTSEIQTWDQTQTVIGPESFVLAYDGGVLRAFFQRLYNAAGTLAVATRSGSSWQLAYANPTYVYNAIRGGSDWHAIVAGSSFGDLRYYMGAPGAWTRDESLAGAGIDSSYAMRLAYASNGDVYIASMKPASGHASYNVKLSKRTGAATWSTIYDVATTGTCVYPVMHEPLALTGGEVMTFEDGFNSSGQRWLRAHRVVNGTWVVEDVANLSWLPYSSCTSGGSSWRSLRMVTAADAAGHPHILYASQPQANMSTLTLEDHYRDASGWHVRTFPLTNGTPLDMLIDSAGTTHLLAIAPSSTPSTTRILYIRISASAW